jgi:hypothetical protein
MTNLIRLWRGELALGQAFWTWAVFGGLAVNLATSGLFLFLMINGHPVAAFIAGYAPSIPYNIVATVGVWRAAGRYPGDRQWADLARVATIIGMAVLTLT